MGYNIQDKPLAECKAELGAWAIRALRAARITTIGELASRTISDIKFIHGLGIKGRQSATALLAKHGLTFRT